MSKSMKEGARLTHVHWAMKGTDSDDPVIDEPIAMRLTERAEVAFEEVRRQKRRERTRRPGYADGPQRCLDAVNARIAEMKAKEAVG